MRMERIVIALLATMWSITFTAPVSAAPRNNPQLTAHEQGTLELIEPMIHAIEQDYSRMNWWLDLANKQKTGWLARFSEGRFSTFSDSLRDAAINLYKVRQSYRGPQIVVPGSMKDLVAAWAEYINVGGEFARAGQRDTTEELWGRLFEACRRLGEVESRFYRVVNARRQNYASVDMSYNLSLELKPIPLKIDFIKNEIKVTTSTNIGPLSLGASGGVSGSRSGVTTLMVIANGTQYVYATGGRVIEFDVPASHIRIDGAVMTIESI